METAINIVVLNDYDNYFENWAKLLAQALESLSTSFTKIIVNSGPYRSYGMEYTIKNPTTVELDFYSAVRNGFGSIGCTPEELATELASKM